jgi:FKBP-type peptidyl-prolyl cis-trans isomerase
MRKWWLIGSGMMLASLTLAGAAIWYIRATRPDDAPGGGTAQHSAVPLGADDGNESRVLSLNTPAKEQAGTGSSAGAGTSAGAGSSAGAASSAPDATKPDNLAVYNQYKDDKTALYQDIRKGTGLEAGVKNTVTVNYRGWLTDGRLFDDSYQTGKTFTFQLGSGRVISGWEQGLVGMKVGGKRRLIVPPAAGYGAEGRDPIPGNAVLVFDIELVDVK